MHDFLTDDRPVLTTQDVDRLMRRILGMTSADTAMVFVTHTARNITRLANDRVRATQDGDEIVLQISTQFGSRVGMNIRSNQLDDTTLRAVIARCEAIARAQMGQRDQPVHQRPVQDTFLPVALWHEATAQAMRADETLGNGSGATMTRGRAAEAILERVTSAGLRTSGFIGFMARVEGFMATSGMTATSEETDCEVTVTARGADGTSSGWAGAAERDWARVNVTRVADDAVHFARLSEKPQALEPGRRMAILGPPAVAQIMRAMTFQFSARMTDNGGTGFSKRPSPGNKLRQRVFDPRVSMSSDPADPDGGYPSHFAGGFATPRMTWVQNGVLTDLAYDIGYALGKGKTYADVPWSIRVAGGDSSIDAMIKQCPLGVYVNRLSSLQMLDAPSGIMTGFTRDGCFLIKDGKIDRALKNFRVLDSPYFFLNRLIALGPTGRAALGYTPPEPVESDEMSWPRRPIVVPPMMVDDFNFVALADAV